MKQLIRPFALFSLVEDSLPNAVVELHYAEDLSVPISTNMKASRLRPWLNVTEVVSETKLSSLTIFRRLKTLEPMDTSIAHTPMSLTLCSLNLTGTHLFIFH